MSNRYLGIKFSEILIEIKYFSFEKIRLKLSFAKWRLFVLGLNEYISVSVLRKQKLCPNNERPLDINFETCREFWTAISTLVLCYRFHAQAQMYAGEAWLIVQLLVGYPTMTGRFPSQTPVIQKAFPRHDVSQSSRGSQCLLSCLHQLPVTKTPYCFIYSFPEACYFNDLQVNIYVQLTRRNWSWITIFHTIHYNTFEHLM